MVRRLYKMGQFKTVDAVNAFLPQLRSDSTEEILEALEQLSYERMPGDAFELSECALHLFQTAKEIEVRKKAATILAQSFTSTPKYALALFAALDDSDPQIPEHITFFLSYLPRETAYVQEFLLALKHKSADVRTAALYQLTYGPFDAEITKEMITLASSSDQQLRSKAIDALASISGKSTEQAIVARDTLISALSDIDPLIQFSAAKGLRRTAESSAEADRIFETCIQSYLESNDVNTRAKGMRELSDCPEGSQRFVARLIELLDESESDQYKSIATLEKLGQNAETAIPSLKRVLFNGHAQRMSHTAGALATLGAGDKDVIDWLASQCLVSNPRDAVSISCAAQALASFGKQAIPNLIQGLKWNSSTVYEACAKGLGMIGTDAVEAVPHLVALLDIGGGQPRRTTCGAEPFSEVLEALLLIAPGDELVCNRVRAIASNTSDTRCNAAIEALERIGLTNGCPAQPCDD